MDIPVQIKHNIGNTLTIPNDIRILAQTYLGNNYQAGVTSILVDNTTDFPPSSRVLVSVVGAENAEFISVSSVPNQTNFTITATLFAHSRGELIQKVEYDQYVIEKAATVSGPYSVFATRTAQVTDQVTQFVDPTGLITEYYRVKLKNSLSGHESDYSIPVSASIFDIESVGAMLQTVRTSFGVSDNDPVINTEFLLGATNEARRVVKGMMANFNQAWLERFEHPIQLLAGRNYANLPDDYDFKYNNGKLLSVRYPRINGLSPYPLTYVDKRQWNSTAYSLKYTYTSGATLSGAVVLNVENIGDFQPAGGTIFISTNTLSDLQILEVTYTGIDLVNNRFTGCTGITRNIPSGTQLFAFPTFSAATYYTVYFDEATQKGRIVFNRPIPNIMHGRNIYVDYYAKMMPVTDINSVLPEQFRDSYEFYIKYAIKYRRDNKTDIDTDPDYKRFVSLIKQWIDNHYIGQMPTIITR